MKFFLHPEHFRWLDALPAPRMPRIRKRGQRHADAVRFDLAPHAGPLPSSRQRHAPRHAATSPRITLVTEQVIEVKREPGCPWTGEFPALTDEVTLAMYLGEYGVKPQREAAEAEQLAEAMLP